MFFFFWDFFFRGGEGEVGHNKVYFTAQIRYGMTDLREGSAGKT